MSGTELLITVFGSVGLLLWGIRMIRTGVNRAFAAPLRQLIARHAHKRVRGYFLGVGVTCLLQSSLATGLVIASFAGRKLLPPAAGLAVILGADLGSSIVVQLLSLRISWLSPLLIGFGVLLFLVNERGKTRSVARVLIGTGLVLLALRLLVVASMPLRHSENLILILGPLTSEPIIVLLLAAALTWMAHSSAAIVLMVAALAGIQVISLQLALILTLGANLGGAVVLVAMTWAASAAARQIAFGNLAIRGLTVFGVVWCIPWLVPYLNVLGDDAVRHIVNFHMTYNLLIGVAFLPAVALVARFTAWIVPDTKDVTDECQPQHLDESAIDTPAVALACAGRETMRMVDLVESMFKRSIDVFDRSDAKLLKEIQKTDDAVDRLHEAIKLYLTRLSREELDQSESERTVTILNFTTNLEHIGDIIDKNLMELAAKKIKRQFSFSSEGLKDIKEFHSSVESNFRLSLTVVMDGDVSIAQKLLQEKIKIRKMEHEMTDRHFARMAAQQPESIETSSLHLDVLRDLKRINSHLTSAAYSLVEGADRSSTGRHAVAPKVPAGRTAG